MKTYWQAMDSDGKVYLFYNEKPTCDDGEYYSCHSGKYTDGITFPFPLKPLQIAEIKVNEDGTWSYEIEREDGWYMAKRKVDEVPFIMLFVQGEFRQYGNDKFINTEHYKISPTRIPDECII